MEAIGLVFTAVALYLPAIAVGVLSSRRGRARVTPAKLDRDRRRVSGTFWIADAHACQLKRREGVWAALGSTCDLDGTCIRLTDEAGARYDLDVAGVAADVHPSARSARTAGRSWVPSEGDMVELSGRVIAQAPTAGYRSATQGAFTLRAAAPGKLRLRLLAPAVGR